VGLLNRSAEGLATGLGIIWLWSAVAKITDYDNFLSTLRAHGVLFGFGLKLAESVPALEAVLGLMLVATAGGMSVSCEPRRSLGRIVLALSAGLLIVFIFYLLRVPDEALRSAGCGCHGGPASVSQSEGSLLGQAVVQNVITLLMHGLAFGLGSRTDSNIPTR